MFGKATDLGLRPWKRSILAVQLLLALAFLAPTISSSMFEDVFEAFVSLGVFSARDRYEAHTIGVFACGGTYLTINALLASIGSRRKLLQTLLADLQGIPMSRRWFISEILAPGVLMFQVAVPGLVVFSYALNDVLVGDSVGGILVAIGGCILLPSVALAALLEIANPPRARQATAVRTVAIACMPVALTSIELGMAFMLAASLLLAWNAFALHAVLGHAAPALRASAP